MYEMCACRSPLWLMNNVCRCCGSFIKMVEKKMKNETYWLARIRMCTHRHTNLRDRSISHRLIEWKLYSKPTCERHTARMRDESRFPRATHSHISIDSNRISNCWSVAIREFTLATGKSVPGVCRSYRYSNECRGAVPINVKYSSWLNTATDHECLLIMLNRFPFTIITFWIKSFSAPVIARQEETLR